MYDALRKQVLDANVAISDAGLCPLNWGNCSVIDPVQAVIGIKPSGVDVDSLELDDIVIVDRKGNVKEGSLRPSSDTPTHLILYDTLAPGAVVHTHSAYVTIFAQARRSITRLGTTRTDVFNGTIPVTRDMRDDEVNDDYERNTGRVIVECVNSSAYKDIKACLVASHGPFIWGATAAEAVHAAIVLERIALMQLGTLLLAPHIEGISPLLQQKHYCRKHGPGAYYGPNNG